MTNPAFDPDDVTSLTRRSITEQVVIARRNVAIAQAAEAAALAHALDYACSQGSSDADMFERDIAAEIALAARMSDRTVQGHMNTAHDLVHRFPATHQALAAGEISRGHVYAITRVGATFTDDETRAVFEADALHHAANQTPGTLSPIIEAIAERLNPEALTDRHARAMKGRGVRVCTRPDAMSDLILSIPSVKANAIMNRTTAIALTVKKDPDNAGDDRGIDEIRADVLMDLLLNGDPTETTGGGITANVTVALPVLTVLGQSNEPAILQGAGPIPVDVALELAGTASGWDRVMTDPYTGCVMAVDRYKPTKKMRRFLVARDEHCRFPGCRRPAMNCDADHTKAHAEGGPTCICNLECLCRRHHTLKHSPGWSLTQLSNGRIRWGTPLGKYYNSDPPRVVRFIPESPPGAPPLSRVNPPPRVMSSVDGAYRDAGTTAPF